VSCGASDRVVRPLAIAETVRVTDAQQPVTVYLRAWQEGDAAAFDQLIELVHAELHRLARARMRGERSGHTFSATDLVSEAFLRLAGANVDFQDRAHFFAVAARTMRQILVDHARSKAAQKRGGGVNAVTLNEQLISSGRPDELLALDDALTALAVVDERKAKTIELRYFAGMEHKEIAAAMNVHINTVARDLRLGEAWIHRHLLEER
jgi:RNA polymerase sigma factor (TIGR02999 family)